MSALSSSRMEETNTSIHTFRGAYFKLNDLKWDKI